MLQVSGGQSVQLGLSVQLLLGLSKNALSPPGSFTVTGKQEREDVHGARADASGA